MNKDSSAVRCLQCGTRNRIPVERWGSRAVCGKCRAPLNMSGLYPDKPVAVDDGSFATEVTNFRGPVLVEFSAPW